MKALNLCSALGKPACIPVNPTATRASSASRMIGQGPRGDTFRRSSRSAGDFESSIDRSEDALSELPTQKDAIPLFVKSAMAVVGAGGKRVSELLASHRNRSAVEPLTHQLQILPPQPNKSLRQSQKPPTGLFAFLASQNVPLRIPGAGRTAGSRTRRSKSLPRAINTIFIVMLLWALEPTIQLMDCSVGRCREKSLSRRVSSRCFVRRQRYYYAG